MKKASSNCLTARVSMTELCVRFRARLGYQDLSEAETGCSARTMRAPCGARRLSWELGPGCPPAMCGRATKIGAMPLQFSLVAGLRSFLKLSWYKHPLAYPSWFYVGLEFQTSRSLIDDIISHGKEAHGFEGQKYKGDFCTDHNSLSQVNLVEDVT